MKDELGWADISGTSPLFSLATFRYGHHTGPLHQLGLRIPFACFTLTSFTV